MDLPPIFATPALVQAVEEPQGRDDVRKLYNQLEPMALGGLGGIAIRALVEFGIGLDVLPRVAAYRLKFLTGPIVCHSRDGDMNGHPLVRSPIYKGQVIADRLKWALDLTEMPVGPTELAMVMHYASLEAPFISEMSELYIWASGTALYRGTPTPHNLSMLNHLSRKFPVDGPPEQILADPTMRLHYFGFANEIQRKVSRAIAG